MKQSASDAFLRWCWPRAVTLVVVGLGLLCLIFGDGCRRLSYDLPFLLKNPTQVQEIVLVKVNDLTVQKLIRRSEGRTMVDRRQMTDLLKRLADAGASLVLFDVIFSQTNIPPSEDVAFAEAMRRHGRVVLGAGCQAGRDHMDRVRQEVEEPLAVLQEAAQGWGLVTLDSVDSDDTPRRISSQIGDYPAAAWVAAQLLDAPVTRQQGTRLRSRWLNYYGPANAPVFKSVSFHEALNTNGVPDEFFRGKIVVVGPYLQTDYSHKIRDEFRSPWARLGDKTLCGLDIHATHLANLLRGEWLVEASSGAQVLLVLLLGILLASLMWLLRPLWLFVLGLSLLTALLAGSALWLQWSHHVWWCWTIPALVQAPLALMWWLCSPPPARPSAFISYRRSDGLDVALTIRSELAGRGVNALLDKHSLGVGPFPEELLHQIESVPNFVFLLTPQALVRGRIERPEDWVHREVAHALKAWTSNQRRRIIVVAVDCPPPDCNSLFFRGGDVTDLSSLALKLGQRTTALSSHLVDGFHTATQKMLDAYRESNSPPASLHAALVEELNRILQDGSLYDSKFFGDTVLRPETKNLLSSNPEGDRLVRLNRLLLEDAFPKELSRDHKGLPPDIVALISFDAIGYTREHLDATIDKVVRRLKQRPPKRLAGNPGGHIQESRASQPSGAASETKPPSSPP